MILVEKHIISPEHELFKEIDNLCFLSKNLYNKANYIVRQEFIGTSKEKEEGKREYANYLNYHHIRKELIKDENYIALPRKVSNHVLMTLDKNWKGFFASIKDWSKNKGKYKGKPSIPKYKHKTKGRFTLDYELGAISKKELRDGRIKLSGTNICVPFINKDNGRLVGARIVPLSTGYYKIEVIYERKEKKENNIGKFYLGVDLGINNLATLTSDKVGFQPQLVNGRIVKSINQFYNKRLASLKSQLPDKVYTSRKIRRMTEKRMRKIEHYFHQVSNFIVNTCLENEIGTIVIGHNDGWKDEANMGDKNNQNFVQIPFSLLISQIKYKGQLNGLIVDLSEESYTSKASFTSLDPIPTYKKGEEQNYEFSGYRKTRGSYKDKKSGKTINADVNGSYNIIRKVAPTAFANGVEGFAVIPKKVKFLENKSSGFYKIP